MDQTNMPRGTLLVIEDNPKNMQYAKRDTARNRR
jgi:hypothetical protein